jgi:hypothetical protein
VQHRHRVLEPRPCRGRAGNREHDPAQARGLGPVLVLLRGERRRESGGNKEGELKRWQ